MSVEVKIGDQVYTARNNIVFDPETGRVVVDSLLSGAGGGSSLPPRLMKDPDKSELEAVPPKATIIEETEEGVTVFLNRKNPDVTVTGGSPGFFQPVRTDEIGIMLDAGEFQLTYPPPAGGQEQQVLLIHGA